MIKVENLTFSFTDKDLYIAEYITGTHLSYINFEALKKYRNKIHDKCKNN